MTIADRQLVRRPTDLEVNVSVGFSVELARLLDVAKQCLPDIDQNLQVGQGALTKTETDHTQAFEDSSWHDVAVQPRYSVGGGLYASLQASFENVRTELSTVMRRLATNIELSEQALIAIHDRYAAADGQ